MDRQQHSSGMDSGRSQVGTVFYANLMAVFLGIIVGRLFPGLPAQLSMALGVMAWLPVSLIKGFAGPLLFLAIFHGLMSDSSLSSGIRKLIAICSINAILAVSIALCLINLIRPGAYLSFLVAQVQTISKAPGSEMLAVKTTNWADAVRSIVPESIFSPFVSNNIPAILILAVLLGVGARLCGRNRNGWHNWFLNLRDGVDVALQIVSKVLGLVLKLMPLAIFAAVTKVMMEHGVDAFKGLSWYVAITVSGMIIQIAFVYQAWIVRRAKLSLKLFWRHAKIPVLYSFGVNSSLSALPATLDALEKLGCSKGSARLGACVGTNFNNDGILLYEVAAVLMLAQGMNLHLSLLEQLGVSAVCVFATLGVSGFPEAGVVALSLVLPAAGMPLELIPLLLPVDWLVARCRSATNVLSDMTVALAIDGPQETRLV